MRKGGQEQKLKAPSPGTLGFGSSGRSQRINRQNFIGRREGRRLLSSLVLGLGQSTLGFLLTFSFDAQFNLSDYVSK